MYDKLNVGRNFSTTRPRDVYILWKELLKCSKICELDLLLKIIVQFCFTVNSIYSGDIVILKHILFTPSFSIGFIYRRDKVP